EVSLDEVDVASARAGEVVHGDPLLVLEEACRLSRSALHRERPSEAIVIGMKNVDPVNRRAGELECGKEDAARSVAARQYGISSITNAVGWKHPAIGERHAAIGRTGEARKLVGPAGDRARVVECNENRITESEDTGLALGEVRCGGSAGVIVGQ